MTSPVDADAYHQCAQESLLGAQVIERQSVGFGEILDEQAQLVGQSVLQMAPLDVEHLVKRSRDVESGSIAVGKFLAAVELLECEPASVGKCVLHLIAVVPYLLGAEYRSDFRERYLGYALKAVLHLLLLVLQLILVGQMLPAATAAYAEMLASRLYSYVRRLCQLLDPSFGIAFLFTGQLHPGHVAWSSVGYEHHHVVDARYRVALGGHVTYPDSLQHGESFFLFPKISELDYTAAKLQNPRKYQLSHSSMILGLKIVLCDDMFLFMTLFVVR